MIKAIRHFLWICGFVLAIQPAFADTFVVKQIKVIGLQRVRESTVLSYMPINIGQPITSADTAKILKSLYKTTFFSDVRLQRSGNTLIVVVVERPTIGLITTTGNKEFTDKQLFPVLKDLGISEGAPFDNSLLNSITQGLRQQYHELGYYAVQVNPEVKAEPRNRVAIVIKIKEGPIAKIKSIHIVGNHVFTEKQLRKAFTSTTTSWWKLTFLSQHDRYSKTQLGKDLENLRNYYYNRGYLRFQVINQKVTISPNNKTVKILVVIKEGPIYKVSGFDVTGLGPAYATEAKIVPKLMSLKAGDTFSRQGMMDTSERIRVYFASLGHAFPIIKADPSIDDAKHLVFLHFAIDPGPISYVRKIDFSGNTRTIDMALRNRLSQMEGSPYSLVDVEQSKQKLAYLPYLSDVTVDTTPVADKPDQVDLNYHVKEVNAGKASIQGGYSTSDGFIYGASLSEPNLMGTGKYGALSFNASQFQKSYSLSYVDPYYTTYGVSRGITVFSTITTASNDQNLSTYTMDGYGAAVTYGIPITLNNRLSLGYGYTYIVLNNIDSVETSPTVTDFVDDHPSPYNQFKLTGSWLYSTLNRAVAPTQGFSHLLGAELGLPVVSNSLSYYKLTEEMRYFYPLGHGFILNPHTALGYGNGYYNVNTLPFFNNFYAGGAETLPGYAGNSLGPQNPNEPGASLGGNVKLLGGLNFIFPNYITSKVRTALTFDAGNIWQTNGQDADLIDYDTFTFNSIRMSAGVMVIWYSPLGPLQFSVAKAINAKSVDQPDMFGFVFGASI